MLRVHVRWFGALGLIMSFFGWGCVPRATDNAPPPAPRYGQWDTSPAARPRQVRKRRHRHHHHRRAARKVAKALPKEHCYFILVVEGMT